jgi:hypothetical protein
MAPTMMTLARSSSISKAEMRRVDAMVTVGSMAFLRGCVLRRCGVSLTGKGASLPGPGEVALRLFATLFTRPLGYVA